MSKRPVRNPDLHGNAPDKSPVALIMIDVINALEFDGGEELLTGVQANICVLFTANDASMRDDALVVPSDCVASSDPAVAQHALEQMRVVLKAQVAPSEELDLEALAAEQVNAAHPLL